MNKVSLKRGFTLVEILIVVAIIAVLASAALVGLGPVQKSGRDARRISDLRQVQNGLELYYAKCGFYPGGVNSGTNCTDSTPVTDWASMSASITGTIQGVTKIPQDPRGTGYMFGTDGSTYILGATLENPGAGSLKDDLDTGAFGVECADPNYCISL